MTTSDQDLQVALAIKAEPDAVWAALTDGEISPAYYYGFSVESAFEPGAPYTYSVGGAPMITGVESGVMTGAGGLQPPATATTVRTRDGELVVEDGPFADTKEQLGGYFVIDVADLDAALAWARRCPSASSASVEVRPLLPPMDG